jgi:hypothetical protein
VGQKTIELAKVLEETFVSMQNWRIKHTKEYQLQIDELLEQ